jgi:predicted nuclease of predicted toxin-antitoxin system
MAARFLVDENVERQVCDRLNAYGHTTEYVPDVSALGIGSSDGEIASYSNAYGCIILTFDDDFVLNHEQSAYHAVVLYEDATISARETADIAQAIVAAYPNSSEIGIEYGTLDWL